MSSAPQQQMLGFFSVFVRWVSNVKETKNGACIRVRSVIGSQWATLQIPVSIAPTLKKGDYIEVVGSVTSLPDQRGASNFLFVQEVLRHVPVSKVGDGAECYPTSFGSRAINRTVPRRCEGGNELPEDSRSPATSSPTNDLPSKKKGGYRSNRSKHGWQNDQDQPTQTAVDVNVQAYAKQSKTQKEPVSTQSKVVRRKPRSSGYSRNRRRTQTL